MVPDTRGSGGHPLEKNCYTPSGVGIVFVGKCVLKIAQEHVQYVLNHIKTLVIDVIGVVFSNAENAKHRIQLYIDIGSDCSYGNCYTCKKE